MAYWLDQLIVYCERRVGLPKSRRGMAKRTFEDYQKAAEPLKAFFGKMLPADVKGHHVAQYLDAGAEADRPVRANREKATLSPASASPGTRSANANGTLSTTSSR
uniref:hypothetical protein n=1 Tax=Bordetella sputigena TaxID=1416810 RepID=UPI0039EDEC01